MLVALIAFLGGYYLARFSKRTNEGFSNFGTPCNVCNQQKPKCGCPCKVCDKPKKDCECKPKPKPKPKTCGGCGMSKPKCACRKNEYSDDSRSLGQMERKSFDNEYSFDDDGPNSMNKAAPPASYPVQDLSKYVLRSTVPPCPALPDMSRYMLKTECPSQPDMSKYVLKASVPKCPPCISTCSKPCKIGECPPCPRPRCPTVNCPEPKPCPACPQVMVEPCPEPRIQCKASSSEPNTKVRPMLASTSQFGL